MIEVEGLSKAYVVGAGSAVALQDIDLRVGSAERLGLFGPSGSGKTTLLRCIAGLEAPEKGTICIDGIEVLNCQAGINVAPWLRPIGVVFQEYALWPHLQVIDNVLFPLRYGRTNTLTRAAQLEAVFDVLRKVQMTGFENRYPSELSGGQRQRVALARALVSQPSVLLLDEPLCSLDPHLRKQTRNELVEILERTGITTIFVSHDHVDGLFMTNSVGIMREGRLVQIGLPQDVFIKPADSGVAETLDLGAIFACRIESQGTDRCRYTLNGTEQSLELPRSASGAELGDSSHMLIRREAFHLRSDFVADVCHQQRLVGQVVREGFTGRGWCVLVSIAGVTIEIWEPEQPRVKHGDTVELVVDTEHVQLLPPPVQN